MKNWYQNKKNPANRNNPSDKMKLDDYGGAETVLGYIATLSAIKKRKEKKDGCSERTNSSQIP